MKNNIPLKRFEYTAPSPDTYAKRMGSAGDPFDTHLPLLQVSLDFEKRELHLEGKDLFEKDPIQKPQSILLPDNERIRVKAGISSGFSIRLSELAKDELVFSIEGSLDDGKSIDSCSGLLVFSQAISIDGSETGQYHLTLYLYDDFDDEREIKLRLIMYAFSETAFFN